MAATYRRVNMKALTRYQIILLGEQRHIGVNNLPKVVARQCNGRELNPRSAHRESNALTTAPPSHSICAREWMSSMLSMLHWVGGVSAGCVCWLHHGCNSSLSRAMYGHIMRINCLFWECKVLLVMSCLSSAIESTLSYFITITTLL